MKLKEIVMINKAPFDKLKLSFNNNVCLLSGINGAGKTTIISHIVDSFYELAKQVYSNEFEGHESKYYRVSSGLYSLDSSKPSIVYLKYEDNGTDIDYIDVRDLKNEHDYDTLLKGVTKLIPYSSIKNDLEESNNVKKWSINDSKQIKNIFNKNLLTYFPSYRYEMPSYLGDPYKIELKFNLSNTFSGYLPNPIEVSSDLPGIANWIMDVVLDKELYRNNLPLTTQCSNIWNNLNEVLTNVLYSKIKKNVRFGIGTRTYGASRISIMLNDGLNSEQIYPSIYNMSAGELSLLTVFSEIIKQSDKIRINDFDNVNGIVLIDEIDKHLHIDLQKNALPKLLSMFPNVQFIVSSHSPFFALGLDENKIKHSIFDLDHKGIECPIFENDLFLEVYNEMLNQDEKYAKLYADLNEKINKSTKPLIITEGKTDWKHIKNAITKLDVKDLDIEFYEYNDTLGDTKLLNLLISYSIFGLNRKIVGIFDRDNFNNLRNSNSNFDSDELKNNRFLSLGNEVYMFSIPLVNGDVYGENISIEHYYKMDDLKKENSEGHRLFLGNEFYATGNSIDGKYQTRAKGYANKVMLNGIIDEKVYKYDDLEHNESIALSKNDFVNEIINNDDYSRNFDFSNFNRIIDILKEIVKQ